MNNLREIASDLPQYIHDSMMDGQRVGYFDVFNEINEEELVFEYRAGEEYFIDDSYCIGSGDNIHKIGLSFVNFGEDGKNPFTEFGVELDLESLEYGIAEESCGEEKVKGVMNHILNERMNLLKALKRRYNEMQEIGRELRGSKRGQ